MSKNLTFTLNDKGKNLCDKFTHNNFHTFPELPVSTVKEPKVSPKLRIYLRSRGKKCRAFQTKDEEEWHEYFSLFNTLCGAKKLDMKEKAVTKKENIREKKEVTT